MTEKSEAVERLDKIREQIKDLNEEAFQIVKDNAKSSHDIKHTSADISKHAGNGSHSTYNIVLQHNTKTVVVLDYFELMELSNKIDHLLSVAQREQEDMIAAKHK
jgi:hypothetical protein